MTVISPLWIIGFCGEDSEYVTTIPVRDKLASADPIRDPGIGDFQVGQYDVPCMDSLIDNTDIAK